MNTIRMIVVVLPMTLLLACGGGGGGGGTAAVSPTTTPPTNTPDPMTPPTNMPDMPDLATLPDYAITNLEAAQMAVDGDAPNTNMTEMEIVSTIQSRATAADTFRFTHFFGDSSISQVDISCMNNNSCSGTIPNVGDLTFSLNGIEDLSLVDDTNLVGFNSDTRVVMTNRGVSMIESRSAGRQSDGTQLTFRTYGGWLDNSVFGVELLTVTENGTDTNRFASFNFGDIGNNSGSNPSVNTTWNGVMAGVATSDGDIIQGKVTIQWDSGTPNQVGGLFSGIKNLTDGGDFGDGLITWESIGLMNGVFTSTDAFVTTSGIISGNFYGDNHEEVGGIFRTDDIIGAFGAEK